MITCEFPPKIVGGLSRHCLGLARALLKENHEVHVVTLDFPGAPSFEVIDGVEVHRTNIELSHPSFTVWTFLFNHFMEKQVAKLNREVAFDLIHIHDWLSAGVGIASKYFLIKPLVSTVHSTEVGRTQELHSPESFLIDGMEWWTIYESKRVIVTSNSMKWELHNHFNVPLEKIIVVPNAIEVTKYQKEVDRESIRRRFGVLSHEKLVLFVGRLVPQKGVEYLIKAAPLIIQRHPETKFVIAGNGWSKEYLENMTYSMGFEERIRFTGFISDSDLLDLTLSADVLTVPSVYEPFGIVALEGMAAGIPVIASKVGGLAEIIEHDRTGVHVYPRIPESLAWGVNRVLADHSYSQWLIQNAKWKVKTYSWEAVAKETVRVYEEACQEEVVVRV